MSSSKTPIPSALQSVSLTKSRTKRIEMTVTVSDRV